MKISNILSPAFRGKIKFKTPYLCGYETERQKYFEFLRSFDGNYHITVDTEDICCIAETGIIAKNENGCLVCIGYNSDESINKNKQIYAMTAYNAAKDNKNIEICLDFTI